MMRKRLRELLMVILGCALAGLTGISVWGGSTPDLIRPEQISPYGLELLWFNRVQMDPARGRVRDWLLDRGTLFVVTDTAMLQAFDAETGRSLWATQVGDPNLLSLKPTAGEHLVSVVNGSTIYILNRHTGVILWKRQTEGAIGAGPLLSPSRVFVPLIRGKIESYRYEYETWQLAALAAGVPGEQPSPAAKPAGQPGQPQSSASPTATEQISASSLPAEVTEPSVSLRQEELRLSPRQTPGAFVMSWGRALVEPRLTFADSSRERIAWPTDRGLLFVAETDVRAELRFEIIYFLQANGDIVAPPSVRPGQTNAPNDAKRMLYVATTNGFVHALREYDGKIMWRFSSGETISQSPALIEDDLYVTTQTGGLYRLNAETGELIWFSRGIRRFVAASDQRVYGADGLNQLVIMDIETGSRLGVMDITRYPLRYMNTETDRIYLADERGLIQCLRETRLATPLNYRMEEARPAAKPRPKPQQPAEGQQPTPPAAPPQAPADENPFG